MGVEVPPLSRDNEFDRMRPNTDDIEHQHEYIQAYMDAVYGKGARIDGEGSGPHIVMLGSVYIWVQSGRYFRVSILGCTGRPFMQHEYYASGSKGIKRRQKADSSTEEKEATKKAYLEIGWEKLAGDGKLDTISNKDLV